MLYDKIKIEGHIGLWHVIEEKYYFGEKLYLLEHSTFGDEAASLIVDGECCIIKDDVWNGFDDLDEEFSWYAFCNNQYEIGNDSLGHYPDNFVEFNRQYYRAQ